jgi:hypothetical protein
MEISNCPHIFERENRRPKSLANKSHTTHIPNMTFINFFAAVKKNIEREIFLHVESKKGRKKKLEKDQLVVKRVGVLRRNFGLIVFF